MGQSLLVIEAREICFNNDRWKRKSEIWNTPHEDTGRMVGNQMEKGRWEREEYSAPQVHGHCCLERPSNAVLCRSVCRNTCWYTDAFHPCCSITTSKDLFIYLFKNSYWTPSTCLGTVSVSRKETRQNPAHMELACSGEGGRDTSSSKRRKC